MVYQLIKGISAGEGCVADRISADGSFDRYQGDIEVSLSDLKRIHASGAFSHSTRESMTVGRANAEKQEC